MGQALTLLLASRSADKVREIREILGPAFRGTIMSLRDAGIDESADEDDIEAFDSFLENAHAKARHFLQLTGLPTLADDSGIVVDALGGAPGVRSRRYAVDGAAVHGAALDSATLDGATLDSTPLDGTALDQANNVRLLRELAGVHAAGRTAHYTCAAVLHMPAGRTCAAVGTCSGLILEQPRGTRGFGYDPLFLDTATGLSFAEIDADRKNRLSHRARAFRALAANLPDFAPLDAP